MTCIIVDDEPLARQGMEMNIEAVASLQLLGSFSNAFAAGDFLRKEKVDIMFLDINMPELNGLDFLKSLRDVPLVIFTTAYPQYALESYELDAIDYLVKPIRIERFLKAVNKAENHLKLLQQESNSNHVEKIEDDFIFIKAERKFFKIYFRNILYIEGLKDYVIIYTAAEKVITAMNVKTIAAQLPDSIFARVSKSYIVNVLHLTSFDNEFVYIQSNEIPLGQSFKDNFMKQYIEGKVIKRQG
ncbi:LytR/AlgR family response regulator transcription factor [Flavihumibacter solisilvae]|uniref:Transcriptional regulator n=1 Tax=Flavihumibacter solisilvae TaxID=1349421 RepID=A0A0C1L366_9BACT|nr:response regulator transcription factor [Flavihumibacter solisilvae]KIC94427.1 transcriptional regulator [Flavihumibacter solisilvae]